MSTPIMQLSRNSSITDSDFEDVSSFSSIDSYKPEPFTGNYTENPEKDVVDTTLMKNDTIIRHDTRTTMGSTNTNATHTTAQEPKKKTSTHTLQTQTSHDVEKTVTHNALNDNVETVESLAAQGLDGTQKVQPDINAPLTMSKTSEFPEEYNIETDTGLVKMKTIETLKRQSSMSTQRSMKSKAESTTSGKSFSSFKSSLTDPPQNQLTADKLNKAVEKNRKQLDKYKKGKESKGIKGFFSNLF